ncbi:MAG: hypothetical protein GY757_03715 [bacterium]|nr:hypothetical protein [bacterium]
MFSEKIYPDNYNRTEQVEKFLAQAVPLAAPKGLFKQVVVQQVTQETGAIKIDGTEFNSATLCAFLEEQQEVFVFAATSGVELEEPALKSLDPHAGDWLNALKVLVLDAAMDTLEDEICLNYKLAPISFLSPDSAEEKTWAPEQQKDLFQLLNYSVLEGIGIHLTENYTTRPANSLTGLFFEKRKQDSTPHTSCSGCCHGKESCAAGQHQ